jgi:amidohydrolase
MGNMLESAREIAHHLIDWRRDFHMHPEVGFNEHRTAARIAETMTTLGWRVRTGVGRTGVVGELGQGAPLVAIRADMDALPIQEADDRPYASQIQWVMHACGHDGHMAMGLGVAALLKNEPFEGTVRLLFQPAEEVADDEGLSGAQRMLQDGALQGVEMILALHVDSHSPVGVIRLASGPASGGVDTFFGVIHGHGGHGARPHETIDPFYLTAHVILALNAIVSRRLDPFDPAVVSIGRIYGGEAENVIPHQVELSGTLRFMDKKVRGQIHDEVHRAFEVARTLGGDYSLEIELGGLPMVNDPRAVELIRATATGLIGAENILPPIDSLGAEDFSVFTDIVPGAMFILGARIEGDERQHHNPRFDIDEGCLPIGAAILAESVLQFLRQAIPSSPPSTG